MDSLPSKKLAPPPYNSLYHGYEKSSPPPYSFYPRHGEEKILSNKEMNDSESCIKDDPIDERSSFLESLTTETRNKVNAEAEKMLRILCPGSSSSFLYEEQHIYKFVIQSTVKSPNINKEALFYDNLIRNDGSTELWQAKKNKKKQKLSKMNLKNSKIGGLFINNDCAFFGGKKTLRRSSQFQKTSKGICIYEKFAKHGERFQPISIDEFSLCDKLVIKAKKYFNHHICKAQADSQLLEQSQKIFLIPVYKIIYRIGDEMKHFFLVGTELLPILPHHDVISG